MVAMATMVAMVTMVGILTGILVANKTTTRMVVIMVQVVVGRTQVGVTHNSSSRRTMVTEVVVQFRRRRGTRPVLIVVKWVIGWRNVRVRW